MCSTDNINNNPLKTNIVLLYWTSRNSWGRKCPVSGCEHSLGYSEVGKTELVYCTVLYCTVATTGYELSNMPLMRDVIFKVATFLKIKLFPRSKQFGQNLWYIGTVIYKPLYNNVLSVIIIMFASVIVKYMGRNLDTIKPCYTEHI